MYRLNRGSAEQTDAIKRLAQHVVVKEVFSTDRLLDQVALFLHLDFDDLSDAQRQTVHELHSGDKSLAGRKVLIVDDDVRNIFALTSILEQHQMITMAAETGRDAIRVLEATPDVDVVLMDVMMPEMDGLDTTRSIRQDAKFRSLPIIAVTAKAMKGDREKCIEAGAWDYLSKPVDPDELLCDASGVARRDRSWGRRTDDRARIERSILVVDDLAAQRLAIEAALAELGEQVVAVSCGTEALRFLLDHDVAVILLDVNMPDMDGFETASLIRQRPRSRHTPIIFLTARHRRDGCDTGVLAGRGGLHSQPISTRCLAGQSPRVCGAVEDA